MTEVVEEALVALYAEVGAPDSGVALAAVGSLARRELGPRSDLDLVLLHDGQDRRRIAALAEKLWYPLWDARIKLDHSVRTPAECTDVAGREVSAGVGLLDLRVVAGDATLVSTARTSLLGAWRSSARRRLPELLTTLDERLTNAGDAAFLLEPDLKEARGGLRDMIMLRALAATWLTDRPHAGVNDPYERLLDVRDALHVSSGRNLDRLLGSEIGEVSTLLGYGDDTDGLRRDVSLAARRIGYALDLTVRSARASVTPKRTVLSFVRRERRPEFTRAEPGLIIHQGEVGLDRDADPSDPLLALRAGALAASRGLVLSPVTAENLGRHGATLPHPWPATARDALFTLLSAGPAVLPVWEALDLTGCAERWLPEWRQISGRAQHNPFHRHTVDRHSIQCVAEAQAHLTRVDRPDLLLISCLLHDIGKLPGAGIEHGAIGAPIAGAVAERMGLSAPDVAVVELLVREHLTLAELATRRDHGDPATVAALVEAVEGRLENLTLLRCLTEADARAAGPAAWSPWRAQLINALADRVESRLSSDQPSGPETSTSELVDLGLARSVRLDGKPRVRFESRPGGMQLIAAAPDRLGLFGDTAGLLAASSISVRSAVLTTVEGVAVNTWRVDKERTTDLPDPALLVQQLERLAGGDQSLLRPVQRREERAHARPTIQPYVELVSGASRSATVIEVRVADRSGLLYSLGRALADERFSVRSAHIATLAGQAIDTLYVTEADGQIPSTERARRAVTAVTSAAAG